jgi:hypothetical protein
MGPTPPGVQHLEDHREGRPCRRWHPAFSGGAPPAAAKVGTAYSFTFTASGQPTPTYHVATGSLPAGLKLSSGGVLAGTPTNVATHTFSVKETNSAGTATTEVVTNTTSKRLDRV